MSIDMNVPIAQVSVGVILSMFWAKSIELVILISKVKSNTSLSNIYNWKLTFH